MTHIANKMTLSFRKCHFILRDVGAPSPTASYQHNRTVPLCQPLTLGEVAAIADGEGALSPATAGALPEGEPL